MAEFLPLTGAELIHADEADAGAFASVTATATLADVIETITWSAVPDLPPQAVVTTAIAGGGATATLSVSIPNFIGMIPIIAIDFLLDGDLETVTDWNEVPAEATEIISYQKAISEGFSYTLTIETAETVAGVSSASYLIIIDPNYTAGRDALIAAVASRS